MVEQQPQPVTDSPVRVVDQQALPWEPHPRMDGVHMKSLLNVQDNHFAETALVLVPLGGQVAPHRHPSSVETVYFLSGTGVLLLAGQEIPVEAGYTVAIPAGMEHTLINRGDVPLQLLALFTPPLG